jgi:hypothetical protein
MISKYFIAEATPFPTKRITNAGRHSSAMADQMHERGRDIFPVGRYGGRGHKIVLQI